MSETYPYKCICGKVGREGSQDSTSVLCVTCQTYQHNGCLNLPFFAKDTGEHHSCHECTPHEYGELLNAAGRDEKGWIRTGQVYDIKTLLNDRRVCWFWTLYARLTDYNIEAMENGLSLKGKLPKKVPDSYLERAEKDVSSLLALLDDMELAALHGGMKKREGTRYGLWDHLKSRAETKFPDEEGADVHAKIGVLAELFGWVAKSEA
ncbi:Transcription factor bye1 [Vermiconidia calcicola]|uniref:Transcription factor bye1 n=1 Tax=Vermiconidia calcicola TaxID=1690605 RepID=A0ACC3NC40_9PEZI|nr:Transcription factor bye1 [Vermiconidia calcicola]